MHRRATASWPPLQLEASSVHGAIRVLASRPPTELRVATWNVWFDRLLGHERQHWLFEELLAAAPDVICLQEVLPVFAAGVRKSQALNAIYAMSPQEVGPYGTMMLVRHDLAPSFDEIQLPTCMARTLLEARCEARIPGLHLMTAHFESLNNEDTRRKQLRRAATALSGSPLALLCGDFNFDDTKTFGDWLQRWPQRAPDELENNVLSEVLPEFVDVWREVHPDDPGYTFDGTTNPVVRTRQERMRYDRVMLRGGEAGLQPQAIAMLGTQPRDDRGSRPSDHYGLLVDLALPEADSCDQT